MSYRGSVLTWSRSGDARAMTCWAEWVGGKFLLTEHPDGEPRVYEMHVDDDGEPKVKSLGTYAEYIEDRRVP